tara:strand:+ start:2974 stop:3135 length:162 start_codon:yes stop_codon:yes gene_type:complete
MKKKNKTELIVLIPVIILIVSVGTFTNYNLIYTTIAGAVGGFIGYLLKLVLKK